MGLTRVRKSEMYVEFLFEIIMKSSHVEYRDK
jgi:hypothetical protein